eukprot:305542-Rhodomonas_salina.1
MEKAGRLRTLLSKSRKSIWQSEYELPKPIPAPSPTSAPRAPPGPATRSPKGTNQPTQGWKELGENGA